MNGECEEEQINVADLSWAAAITELVAWWQSRLHGDCSWCDGKDASSMLDSNSIVTTMTTISWTRSLTHVD